MTTVGNRQARGPAGRCPQSWPAGGVPPRRLDTSAAAELSLIRRQVIPWLATKRRRSRRSRAARRAEMPDGGDARAVIIPPARSHGDV